MKGFSRLRSPSFGMLMPARKGHSVAGGWATSGGSENRLPASLELRGRSGNQPLEYRATESIEFTTGFTSGEGDSFETFITEESGSGGGSSSGSGDIAGGYRYGFNGKENDDDVKGEGEQQDYGMRIYDPRVGRFLSTDPLTKDYPYLTPYQFASNSPIAGIDLDGLEFFKKDNTQYTIDYKPVVDAPGVLAKADNAAHNAMSFVWNVTLGAAFEVCKSANNYFAGGYKEPSTDVVASFNQFQTEACKYTFQTPIKQQFKDYLNVATDLRNYELPAQLILAHRWAFSNGSIAPPVQAMRIPVQEEIFTNSISTRGLAEHYAENVTFKGKGYFNANEYIGANNEAFDLISTMEKNVVDVATTTKQNLKISTWETNKLDRLGTHKDIPQGYSRTLQLYVKQGQYTSQEIANYQKSLNDYIKNSGLKNVNASLIEIPKSN